jgi:hypothetical protein
MKRLIFAGLIQWASNVGAVVNGLFVKIHASQEILQMHSVDKCGPILQNLNFGQINMNSCFNHKKTQLLDRCLAKE